MHSYPANFATESHYFRVLPVQVLSMRDSVREITILDRVS